MQNLHLALAASPDGFALHLQARQFEPDYGRVGPGEEWDEALGYLDACGPGVNLIARTSSELPGTRWGSLISQGSGTLNSWLEESTSSDVSLGAPRWGCT